MKIHSANLVAAIAHVDNAHAKFFTFFQGQIDFILADHLAEGLEGFTGEGFGFDPDDFHDGFLLSVIIS
jgi:hypothetical protein